MRLGWLMVIALRHLPAAHHIGLQHAAFIGIEEARSSVRREERMYVGVLLPGRSGVCDLPGIRERAFLFVGKVEQPDRAACIFRPRIRDQTGPVSVCCEMPEIGPGKGAG